MEKSFTPIDPRAKEKTEKGDACPKCFRPNHKCICAKITPQENKLRVIVLMHPQEQYKLLNSSRLTHLLLKNSSLCVGLSWPNFKAVAGEHESPSQWGVLHLKPEKTNTAPVFMVDKKNKPVENMSHLRGIIVLDGSWKQAKSLWWRNAWLLKLNRMGLNPTKASLRPQVKQEGLSTIEAVAAALEFLGENVDIPNLLRKSYEELIIDSK